MVSGVTHKIKIMSLQREEEKQRQQKRHQELMGLARQHYHRTLLSHRGLAPWKRLIQLRQASMEVNHLFIAAVRHQLALSLRFLLGAQENLQTLVLRGMRTFTRSSSLGSATGRETSDLQE